MDLLFCCRSEGIPKAIRTRKVYVNVDPNHNNDFFGLSPFPIAVYSGCSQKCGDLMFVRQIFLRAKTRGKTWKWDLSFVCSGVLLRTLPQIFRRQKLLRWNERGHEEGQCLLFPFGRATWWRKAQLSLSTTVIFVLSYNFAFNVDVLVVLGPRQVAETAFEWHCRGIKTF